VTVKHHWKKGLETPEGWNTSSAQLLDLGDGRFCIAKFVYEVGTDEYDECQIIGKGSSAHWCGAGSILFFERRVQDGGAQVTALHLPSRKDQLGAINQIK